MTRGCRNKVVLLISSLSYTAIFLRVEKRRSIKKFVAYITAMLMLSNMEKALANKGSIPQDVEKYF